MKHFLIFIFVVISLVSACSMKSPTPSMGVVTPPDSSIFDLDNITYIEIYLPDFEQEIQLQISDDSSFLSILYDNVFHEENHRYIPADFFRENTAYYWRIRGRDPDNNNFTIFSFIKYRWSDWSECLCFFVR